MSYCGKEKECIHLLIHATHDSLCIIKFTKNYNAGVSIDFRNNLAYCVCVLKPWKM